MQLIFYVQLLFTVFLFVFYTQYDHYAQLHQEYNNYLHQQYKLVVSTQPGVLVFLYRLLLGISETFLYLTPVDVDEKWHGLIL